MAEHLVEPSSVARSVSCGIDGAAHGTHQLGCVAAHHAATGEEFECPYYGVVLHRAALYHDVVAQYGRIGEAQHLEQTVLHHRVGQACRDVGHGGSLAEGLLHLRVHEHRAACT